MSGTFTAISLFALAFGFSAFFVGNGPWQFARFQALPFPEIDPDAVQRQVKARRFKRPWLEVTLLGSTLVGAAGLIDGPMMLVPLLTGLTLIGTFGLFRGFFLFKTGVAELGIDWPPKKKAS
ncbi:MAG TPA: hypothetical protein VFI88_00390 [Sphingomicrobium sp.]|jgi:hypothetical protein|nr:hypothetical protein [Sphingomicrobium sp.]